MSYKDTSLWKRTLGKEDKNVEPLRESYLDARKNAEFLLGKIRNDFPNLTVHDITHVDSLWNVADVIIGEKYDINPLEGYILGVAFLIHDAALSYDAVGGKAKLRETVQWKDVYADGPGDKDEEDFKKECDFAAIRALHAKYAEDILNKKFEKDNTTTFYIIDNDEYRIQFGDRIGKIAASHHWSIDEVESNLDIQINPLAGFPNDWEINEQKLACILRCADAGHIDNGRAPFGIYNSLIVNGVSREHWESQTRLGQVREYRKNPEQLLITSTRLFPKDNFAAWNVAYDAVRLFDEELKKSNELLKSEGLSFPHIGVTGAESKEALSEYIKTDGWKPCSFGVHTSNVKALIENLGGSKLYGEENLLFVVLRELIQNARDAIQARRTMDGRPEEGQITIRHKEKEGKHWIEVEDDGIGMSLDCIKYNLLDFGSSYWKSNLAKDENPGLRSKRFNSIGKFGIGFYSVFMVAKSVVVMTRRYEGSENANIVEFPEGLTLSPILSTDKLSTRVSTLVRFELKDDIDLFFSVKNYPDPIPLQKSLPIIVAGLDADVYFDYNNKIKCIHRNILASNFNKEEWLKSLCVDDVQNNIIKEFAESLEWLQDINGKIYGLIAIPNINKENKSMPSIETICGLAVSLHNNTLIKGYIGYINCKEGDISRNSINKNNRTFQLLRNWLILKYNTEYYNIVSSRHLSNIFAKAFSYCELDTNEIEKGNEQNIYAAYKTLDIKIGTIKGLKRIHTLLFSGITELAGVYRINDVHFGSNKKNSSKRFIPVTQLDDTLKKIDKMPDENYDQIISKYIQIVLAHPFLDGNGRCVQIWLNLLLKVRRGYMIDWENIDRNIYYGLLQNASEDEEPIHDYLKSYLIK